MENPRHEREPSESGSSLARQNGLERALAETDDIAELRELQSKATALETYLQRMNATLERQNALAVVRLRITRKIGLMLRQTVQQGGRGSKSQHVTSIRGGSSAPLPGGISRMQSHRYQQLAEVSEEDIERYHAECNAKVRSVSAAGLIVRSRKWSGKAGPTSPKAKPKKTQKRLGHHLAPVWDAVRRLMDVDLAFGVTPSTVGATTQIAEPADAAILGGRVAGVVAEHPKKWLKALADRTRIEEAVLVLPAETSEPWFLKLAQDGWSCCFVVGGSARLVAYHGDRKHGFWLAFQDLGPVFEA